jgi:transcriptional regulator of acetoin/glycerol metabolism
MLYPWPGNVRELQHAMEHAFVMCPGGLISVRHLPSEIREASPSLPGQVREDPMERCDDLRKALEISGGNKAKAARLLGISRQTLYRRLQERQGEVSHPTRADVTLV